MPAPSRIGLPPGNDDSGEGRDHPEYRRERHQGIGSFDDGIGAVELLQEHFEHSLPQVEPAGALFIPSTGRPATAVLLDELDSGCLSRT